MKLQVNGQQWRLRVSEDELKRLRDGDSLSSSSVLPGHATFRLQLELAPLLQASVQRLDDGWKFVIPAALVEDYVLRLPCRDGLDFVLPVTTGVALELAFEVDVRDSVRQRGVGIQRH